MAQSRRRTAAALPMVLLVAATACGDGGKKAATGRAPTTIATTTTTLPPEAPLTGLPVTDRAVLDRPALAVKIDNISDARPQAGLDKADVVYEEVTEGITRFVAVFHSTNAESIGPVRSVRPADPQIVGPLGGLFVFSGGSGPIVALVRSAGLPTITENNTDTLRRRSDRSAPQNLYTSTEALYRKASADAKAPPKFAEFLKAGQPFAASGVVPTTTLSVAVAPGVTADYAWDAPSGTWRRSTDRLPHELEGGGQIAPTNVIIQFTAYSRFPADTKVTYPEVVGSGDAWIFAGGMLAKGRFSKSGAGAMTTYTDDAGAPIVLPPGRTFVELVAPGSTVTTG